MPEVLRELMFAAVIFAFVFLFFKSELLPVRGQAFEQLPHWCYVINTKRPFTKLLGKSIVASKIFWAGLFSERTMDRYKLSADDNTWPVAVS